MIDKALNLLIKDINTYLGSLFKLSSSEAEKIVLTNIGKDNGNVAIPSDSLGLTLVNIEEERVVKSQMTTKVTNGNSSHINPEIKLNLYAMVCANFNDYKSGLAYLSGVVRFFQGKSVFTRDNTPGLDESIKKLIVELYSLSFEQQNHIWGSIGVKYLPSVLYKIRLVTIKEDLAKDEFPVIEAIGLEDNVI
ncbi:MAG: DUF4255 domain-containing protein [Ignavibacteria bacterium]|jgi:hypothetical protein